MHLVFCDRSAKAECSSCCSKQHTFDLPVVDDAQNTFARGNEMVHEWCEAAIESNSQGTERNKSAGVLENSR